jgi:polyferredoxin
LFQTAASADGYRLLADAVLVLHCAIAVFVVGGLALVVVGNVRGWHWVNNLWLRLAHLAAIGVVVAQAWLGKICPLTTLESWLRAQAGEAPYSTSFIQHWMQRVLYYEAPFWVFTLAYTVFGLLVVASWWRFPPGRNAAPGPAGDA